MNGKAASPITGAVARHRLADVAGRTGIHLAATSRTLTVRCPMPAHGHPDRTPSMRLYLDDDRYYCFGCGARGDVVQWVKDAEGVSVAQAVYLLDSRRPIANAWPGAVEAGRRVRPVGHGDGPDPARTPAQRVLEVLEAAWTTYSTGERHRTGTAYLSRRGIDVAVLEGLTGRREIGHSMDGGRSLAALLSARGFTGEELIDAGLARRSVHSGRLVDTYRRRVLVPIRTLEGSVCALVGRNVGDPHAPKYLNPPLTAVYDKSTDLYHPLPAPPDRQGRAVVVEGTLDALALATVIVRAGMTGHLWPVTQSGRELSSAQVDSVLSACAHPPLLALDADPAGREAAERISAALAARDVRATRACMPEGSDPASCLTSAGGCSPGAAKLALLALSGAVPPHRRTFAQAAAPAAGASAAIGVAGPEFDL